MKENKPDLAGSQPIANTCTTYGFAKIGRASRLVGVTVARTLHFVTATCLKPVFCLAGESDAVKEVQACAGLWIEVNKHPAEAVSNKQQSVFITIAQLKAFCERPEWASKVVEDTCTYLCGLLGSFCIILVAHATRCFRTNQLLRRLFSMLLSALTSPFYF